MSFIKEAIERGFIYQSTNLEKIKNISDKQSIVGYIGFDPTATSLHVGHLTCIMLLRLFQKYGHTPIVLIGGGTAKIGDPFGKDYERPMMSPHTINKNKESIKKIYSKYINFENAKMLDNSDWLDQINYIDFLREYGSYFTINHMITFETVKSRLETQKPLTFLEFNYPLLQAYDFLTLYKKHNCIVQFGGSDQWGNIIYGVDLIHKKERKEGYGLTFPLITTASGKKMGKTETGAIWLDEKLLSPFDFWQFWRNTDDKDVIRYLKLFTDIPIHEIKKLSELSMSKINDVKKILADEVTKLCHGKEVIPEIHKSADQLFYDKGHNLESIAVFYVSDDFIRLDDLLFKSGLCESKGMAKRSVIACAIQINKEKQNDPFKEIKITQDEILLSFGKKKHIRIIKK